MCRQSIRLAVVQKFNEKYQGWNLKTFDELYNKIDDVAEANTIINDLKICDPAVGSGHFLVSALNEIIAIKSELRILTDTNGKRLKEYSIEVVNDELIVTDEDGDIFQYNPANKESQRVQETLFHQKQLLIENCLFGVDINPKSVLICRLRLWIELLKNAYYQTNGELETLPNIDINIKCGNSLLSRFPLNSDLSEAFKKQQFNLKTYKLTVETNRNSTDKKAKRELLDLIDKIKKEYSKTIFLKDPLRIKVSEARGLLELAKNNYDLFGKKISEKDKEIEVRRLTLLLEQRLRELEEAESGALYKNAFEWRFEFPEVLNNNGQFVGFDLVIGNPPYIALQKMKEEQKVFATQKYETYSKLADIYCLFYEKGIQLLKDKGTLTYITSNSWLRTQYGEQLRKYFVNHANPLLLLNIEDKQVFEEATVESNIIVVQKAKWNKQLQAASLKEDYNTGISLNDYFALHSITITDLPASGWTVGNEEEASLKLKIETDSKLLMHFDVKLNFGIKTGYNDAFIVDEEIKNQLISEDSKNARVLMPLLRGKDLKKYSPQFANQYLVNTHNGVLLDKTEYNKYVILENGKEYLFLNGVKLLVYRKEEKSNKKYRINRVVVKEEAKMRKREDQGDDWTNLRNCDYLYDFAKDKIIWGEISDKAKFAYDDTGKYTNDRCSIMTGTSLKYFTAILNSKVTEWYFNQISTSSGMGTNMWKIYKIEQLPIKELSEQQQQPFITLVDQILAAKKQNPAANTTALENQIDQLVYQLYNITPAEQKIIEGK
jgi:type II restriction/modification system DNA methylase subunit YeeA